MYIPEASLPAVLDSVATLVHLTADDSSRQTGWSSLIGIVTAICGNVLISFALNTQRYAHMRLSRDRDEWEEKQRAGREQDRRKPKTYGTQQLDVAEQRARKNANSEPDGNGGGERDYTLEEPTDMTEADPLIPHVRSRGASTDSEDTVRPDKNDEEAHHEKSYLRSPIWEAWPAMTNKPLPKLRKDKAAARHEKRKGKGQHEERDCVVM
ncbi:hypothetical protein B0A55_05492 [Friedmanniomyces simplex]|uniref:Uncharacterized protein n=1 Tax=Friedmanniomyces simplex TaxID=329884 RepID=A0A4U0XA42_9PEZI|nr:hypothetical protein B0A55_05492 [Friedmanniomyces simplex]